MASLVAVPPPGPAATNAVRVISLAPSLTEIVFAVGAGSNLVGRTSACNYPPEAERIPVVGGFGVPALETLVALRPDVVLDVDLEDETIAARIRSLGIRQQRIRCQSLNDIPPAIREVGRVVQQTANADTLAKAIERAMDDLRAEIRTGTPRPRVLTVIWADPLTTVGRNTFLSELVALAGGANVGDARATPYFQVSDEWVLEQNPDTIFCFYMSDQGSARSAILQRPGWNRMKAVKEGRVFDGFNPDVILRPGPRVAEAVSELKKGLQAQP
jgi:iron complex transport system substrate-binding protein